MQEKNIINISANNRYFPESFKLLPQPVEQLYAMGNLELLKKKPRLGIIGSRRMTAYGKEVTTEMANSAARAGATIVSGLALGVDGTAHQAALDSGGDTIAVLPSSIYRIYPASHQPLARRIVEQNGLLLTEFTKDEQPMKHYFIQRNRLIAAISDVLLITEASMGSGTRHTVEFTIAEGKEIVAVPADINKHSSSYTNYLIQNGCKPMFSTRDLLSILGLNENLMKPKYQAENKYEDLLLKVLGTASLTFNELLEYSKLETKDLNVHLTMLEIKAAIEPVNNKWRLT